MGQDRSRLASRLPRALRALAGLMLGSLVALVLHDVFIAWVDDPQEAWWRTVVGPVDESLPPPWRRVPIDGEEGRRRMIELACAPRDVQCLGRGRYAVPRWVERDEGDGSRTRRPCVARWRRAFGTWTLQGLEIEGEQPLHLDVRDSLPADDLWSARIAVWLGA